MTVYLLKWYNLLRDKGKYAHVLFHSLYRVPDTVEFKAAAIEVYPKVAPNPINEDFGFLINQIIENDKGGLGK